MGTKLENLTDLFVDAHQAIKTKVASRRSVDELFEALTLFKNNELEGVVFPKIDGTVPEPTKRREVFKERLATEGADVLWREFLERLIPTQQKNLVESNFSSLLDIISHHNLRWERLIGKKAFDDIEKSLSFFGLYTNMSSGEIINIFGKEEN